MSAPWYAGIGRESGIAAAEMWVRHWRPGQRFDLLGEHIYRVSAHLCRTLLALEVDPSDVRREVHELMDAMQERMTEAWAADGGRA